MIGLAVCLRWILSSMITLEIVPTSALNQGPTDQNAFTKSLNHHQQPPEECTPNEVITEFSNRLLLLENAFREQVFARETIAKEVNDQTDIYTDLEQKLAEVLQELSNISVNYKLLEAKYKNLSDRIYSDGKCVEWFSSNCFINRKLNSISVSYQPLEANFIQVGLTVSVSVLTLYNTIPTFNDH